MKILIPLDIVHPVKATIAEVGKVAPVKDAEVKLLYVKEQLPSYEAVMESAGDFEEDWGHQIEKKAREAFLEAEAHLKELGASVSTEIVSGSPAMMIETVARDENMDMIALTPGSRSKVEKFLLGSVSSNVVKHGPGTILICRRDDKSRANGKEVVLGIDGSKQSHNALTRAVEQFGFNGDDVKIHLIHVVSVADVLKLVSPVEYIAVVENNMLLEGETFLAEGKRMLADLGLTSVECVLKEGDPATEIINLAMSVNADLIVIGAQGHTAVEHFLLGSVSHRIAMRSPCSTAVIKPS